MLPYASSGRLGEGGKAGRREGGWEFGSLGVGFIFVIIIIIMTLRGTVAGGRGPANNDMDKIPRHVPPSAQDSVPHSSSRRGLRVVVVMMEMMTMMKMMTKMMTMMMPTPGLFQMKVQWTRRMRTSSWMRQASC